MLQQKEREEKDIETYKIIKKRSKHPIITGILKREMQ